MSTIGDSGAIRRTEEYLVTKDHNLAALQSFSVRKGRYSAQAFAGITPKREIEENLLIVCNDLANRTLDPHTITLLKDKKGYLDPAKVTNFASNAEKIIKDLRDEYTSSGGNSIKLEALEDCEQGIQKIKRLANFHSKG